MNGIALSLFGINIYWYGIIASVGAFIALKTGYSLARSKGKFVPDEVVNVVLLSLPFGIIGARLYYVAFRWSYYSQNLGEILAFRDGGLAFHGGLIAGILVGIIYCRFRKIPIRHILDCCGPALLIGQGIGRWGNFVNQEAYGNIVSKSYIEYFPEFIEKGMYIDGNYYHPTFLYEFLWNVLVFAVIMIFWKKYKEDEGIIFSLYLIGYSGGRFLIEALRTDSLMIGQFRIAQLVSILCILIGITYLIFKFMRNPSQKKV